MRSFLRCSFVWLVALAFVANGFAWRQCIAAQHVLAATANQHHSHDNLGHHSHLANQGDDDRQIIEHQDTSGDAGQQPVDSTCSKCCSICTVAGIAQTAERVDLIFSASSISFYMTSESNRDRTI